MSEEAVLSALTKVPAPGAEGESIVSLGYVRDLKVEGEKVSFRVEFPTPLTPARLAVEARCREALGERGAGAEIELESRIPATFQPAEGEAGLAPGVKNFVAIGSGKGGVGKSTIALNVAVGLAKAGARVGLLDADVYGPSVPLMLNVTHAAYMEELKLGELESPPPPGQPPSLTPYLAHGVHSMSIGYLIPPEQAAIWRGPMVHGALTQLLRDVTWGELDYLVIDLPPGTGDVHLSLSQQLPLAGVAIVCTPQPVALADARKAVGMLTKTNTECLGIVQNMAYHHCDSCGHEDDVFGSRGAEDAAEEWQIPFLGSLPLNRELRIAGDKGVPLLARDEESPLADALWAVVDRLTSILAGKVRSRPRSLPISRS
jgi:ATP-binding protein involved in chromosome partitioning